MCAYFERFFFFFIMFSFAANLKIFFLLFSGEVASPAEMELVYLERCGSLYRRTFLEYRGFGKSETLRTNYRFEFLGFQVLLCRVTCKW